MTENTTTTTEYVDPCPGMKGDDEVRSTCGKCLGDGVVHYGNVVFAVRTSTGTVSRRTCFDCNGSGVYVQKVKNIRAAARREHKRLVAVVAEQAENAARLVEWNAAHPALAARLAAVHAEVYIDSKNEEAIYAARNAGEAKYGAFVMQMASDAAWKPLTENQAAAVVTALDKAEVKAAAAATKADAARYIDGVEGDKVEVTGTVVVSMSVDGFAYGSTSRMVVVEGTGEYAGITVKMTGAAASLYETERGDTVRITGKIKDFREYNGTPQTVLNYAKAAVLATA